MKFWMPEVWVVPFLGTYHVTHLCCHRGGGDLFFVCIALSGSWNSVGFIFSELKKDVHLVERHHKDALLTQKVVVSRTWTRLWVLDSVDFETLWPQHIEVRTIHLVPNNRGNNFVSFYLVGTDSTLNHVPAHQQILHSSSPSSKD